MLASLLILLVIGIAVAVLPPRTAGIITRVTNTTICLGVAVCCCWTGWRARGPERRWRLLIGLAAALAAAGFVQVVRALWAQDVYVAPRSIADAAYLVVWVPALAGLLAFPTEPVAAAYGRPSPARDIGYRWYAITVLDSVLLVGSLTLLAWSTVLSAIVQAGISDPAQFAVLIIHEVVKLVVIIAIALFTSFRRPRSGPTLAMLGWGLTLIGITGSVFTYFGAIGVHIIPPVADLGLLAGLLLLTLACLAPSPAPVEYAGDLRRLWMHTMLPYAALAALGLLFLGQLIAGTDISRPELYGLIGLLLVALVRQLTTLVENTRLIARVQAGQRALHYQAFHDPLTGLANRALFADRLEHALARQARDHLPIALVFCDLDDFKQVNDSLGHAAGDELLQITARRLREAVRSADTVARLGGDEFAVIVTENLDDPEEIRRRLSSALTAPCVLAGRQPYPARASVGVVVADLSAGPVTPDLLLQQADIAMYAAKRKTKKRLVHYLPKLAEPAGESARDTARESARETMVAADLARVLRDDLSDGPP